MRKILKKIAFPILNKWYQAKTKKVSKYSKHGLNLEIQPGVFHPGVFLSTNIFIDFLKTRELSQKKVLELGAGSGMISLFAAKNGAIVTSTDINENAIKGLSQNAVLNELQLDVIKSNLFENIDPNSFDFIIINPPYYPKTPTNSQEHAFYCGENFEYFNVLFTDLKNKWTRNEVEILMILSEDCEIERIKKVGAENKIELVLIFETSKRKEKNYIFQLKVASI